ncbi:MAG: ComEC/Rec2 family competence protein [Chlamydiia bacterium]|nr:ComEC/Rec2 family competence protein [Chlamydiia bacterium]
MQMTLKDFWKKNPALLLGLSFYFAALFAFGYPLALLLFLPICLPVVFCSLKWCACCLIVFLFFWIYIHFWYQIPEQGCVGKATITISSIHSKESLFSKKGWLYRGRIKKLVTDTITLRPRLPYTLFIQTDKPQDHSKYEVMATVYHDHGRHLYLKPKVGQSWSPISEQISIAKWRFLSKDWVKKKIHQNISSNKAAIVLAALATGDLNDKVTIKEFRDLGLAHLMAISGFHFSLLAFFFHLFLRLFVPYPFCYFFLLLLLTLYFFFIGASPSIERAYLMITIFLFGQLIARRAYPLNSLGIALMISIARDPLVIFQLGFQFSYLATVALLIFMSPIKKSFEFLIPSRSFNEVIASPIWKRHVFVLLSILRDLLTLDVAVHLVIIPFSLSVFHTFSFSGLLFNLFFPFLMTLSLVLLLFGPFLMSINSYYTHLLLTLTEFKPPLLGKSIWIKEFPPCFLGIYFLILFLGGILLQTDQKNGSCFNN